MFMKGTVAAGIMAAVLAFVPDTALAKTKIQIGIGAGSDWCYYRPYAGGCGYGYGYYHPPVSYYHAPGYFPSRWNDFRISCGEASDIVREHGFRKVRTRSCGRTISSFIGVKRGGQWLVKVNTRNGRIAGARRL